MANLDLNVADARNPEAKRSLGFENTPHFFFLRPRGSVVAIMDGVIPSDSLNRAIERLLLEGSSAPVR